MHDTVGTKNLTDYNISSKHSLWQLSKEKGSVKSPFIILKTPNGTQKVIKITKI